MDKLLAMQTFVRVVEAGTFAKAADSAGLPKPTVTRLIQGLESHLQTKLLNRTTRRVTVTVHYSGCDACEAELRIGRVKTLLRAHGGVARGTSPRLALGRARAIVVLTGVGIRLSASRPVVIR